MICLSPVISVLRPGTSPLSAWFLWLPIACVACVGEIAGTQLDENGNVAPPGSGGGNGTIVDPGGRGGSGGSVVKPPPGTGPAVGQTALLRLTHRQYNNTVRDLLGDNGAPASKFPADERQEGRPFPSNISLVAQGHAEEYITASRDLALRAVNNAAGPVRALDGQCNQATVGREVCARTFIREFGLRALRRPLAEEQVAALVALQAARPTWTAGQTDVIQALLQSPYFLFHMEGAVAGPKEISAPVSDYEIASRLSYLLWESMPDRALFEAAAAGKLRTREEVELHARRMVTDPKAASAVENFYTELMDLSELDFLGKPGMAWPALRESMKKETIRFVEHLHQQGESLGTLLAAPFSFMDQTLATFYGVTYPTSGTGLQKLDYDIARQPRAGILTHAGILANKAGPVDTEPFKRGDLIAKNILCITFVPPVMVDPVPAQPGLTRRQELEAQSNDPCGAACHPVINPLGFGLENYDAIGRYQTTDPGSKRPIDASGALVRTDVDGPFTGAAELAKKLAGSRQAADCLALQWTRFATGRETKDDGALRALQDDFSGKSGKNLRELLVSIAGSEILRHRAGGQP